MADHTILVCDDEPHILHIVATKLRNGGFNVVTAADGEEAFGLSQDTMINLVVTDYQMPVLSGLELCAKLRSQEATRDIPVIMLTARGFSMKDDDLKETNIRKVLAKPFSPRELLRCSQELLNVAPVSAAPASGGCLV